MCLEVTFNGARLTMAGDSKADEISVAMTLYPTLSEGWLDVAGGGVPGQQPAAAARRGSAAVKLDDVLQLRLVEGEQPSAVTLLRTQPDAEVTDAIALVCAFCEKKDGADSGHGGLAQRADWSRLRPLSE